MCLFKLFEKKNTPEQKGWIARTGDKEFLVDPKLVTACIDDALTDVEEGYAEFFVLTPSNPVNYIAFLQVCPDQDPGFLHIEAGLSKKARNRRIKILACDHLSTSDVFGIFVDYFKGSIIDTSGWYELL